MQMLVVGQRGQGRRTQEVAVPAPEHRQNDGQVALERRSPEILVDRVRASQQLREPVEPNRQHDRQADRRAQRVARPWRPGSPSTRPPIGHLATPS